MKKSILLLNAFFLFLLLPISNNVLTAQINQGVEILDESFFIAGIASNVLKKDQVEIIANSSLNSFWLAIHARPVESPVIDRLRQSSFVSTLDAFYGFSQGQRWDLGLRLHYTRSRLDNEAQSSPFKVFSGSSDDNLTNRTDETYGSLTGIGLRTRIAPIASVPGFTVTAGYNYASVREDTVASYLNAQRDWIDLDLSYYVKLNSNSYYYFIVNNAIFLSQKRKEETAYSTGLSFFLVHSLFANKLVLYPGLSYNFTYKKPAVENMHDSLIKTSEQFIGIIGAQFRVGSALSVYTSFGIPILLNNSFLQVSQVRSSYSLVNLGIRLRFN